MSIRLLQVNSHQVLMPKCHPTDYLVTTKGNAYNGKIACHYVIQEIKSKIMRGQLYVPSDVVHYEAAHTMTYEVFC